MEENRWGVVYCPKSGLFGSSGKWERIKQCLKDNNIAYDHVQSENRGSVDRLVKMLINNGYKTIIIVGGDSALNDAINCLMQVEKEKRDSIVLGVIPNGMMNDFAHFWDFDEDDYEQTVKWLKDRKVRKIDLGCVRYFNKKGDPCRRYFLNCVNIGLIASIMNLRRQTRHFFGSRTLSFFFSFIMMVFQRLEYRMSLKINSDIIDRKVMTMCVGNARGYGQTPNAVPYNGLLDVSVVYHPAMTQLFEGFYLFVRGKFLNHRRVHPYRTREVVVNKAERALIGIDGRLMRPPVGPYRITVEQEVINFLIPA
jgi:Sphingosine kinase and enzymes related to eukaryotic diacylglycerol kinase